MLPSAKARSSANARPSANEKNPSIKEVTVDIVKEHSSNLKNKIDKHLGRHHSMPAMWEEGQTVPPDLIPYLRKVQTQEMLAYLESEEDANPRNHVRSHAVRTCARRILKLPGFDFIMGLIILINLVVMIIDTDRSASEEDTSGTSLHWTENFSHVILLIFLLELTIRMIAMGCIFWLDPWNTFDCIIVVVDAAFSIIFFISGAKFPVSILRIFRLVKIVRVFKVLRVFPELRLLLAGLVRAMSAIAWGTLLLFFCMLVWAMIAVLFIHPLNESIDHGTCDRCPRAYSSVMQATLTIWQSIVTGDSWGLVTIPVIEKYPSSAVYFVAVYLTVGMAVTNLILGVVVNVAQQAQDALGEADNTEIALGKLASHTRLLHICRSMDTDGDGNLSRDEAFSAFNEDGDFRELVMGLDITPQDFDIAWRLIDNHNKGYASYKEIVSFLSSMKANDPQFMLSYIKYYITVLKEDLLGKSADKTGDIGRRIEEDTHEIAEQKDESLSHDQQSQDSGTSIQRCEQIAPGLFDSCAQQDSITAPDDPSANPDHHSANSVDLQRHNDPMLTAFDNLRSDICILQLELKGILKDMDCKLDQQALHVTAMDLSIASQPANANLTKTPARKAFCNVSPLTL